MHEVTKANFIEAHSNGQLTLLDEVDLGIARDKPGDQFPGASEYLFLKQVPPGCAPVVLGAKLSIYAIYRPNHLQRSNII